MPACEVEGSEFSYVAHLVAEPLLHRHCHVEIVVHAVGRHKQRAPRVDRCDRPKIGGQSQYQILSKSQSIQSSDHDDYDAEVGTCD
jgi:transposase